MGTQTRARLKAPMNGSPEAKSEAEAMVEHAMNGRWEIGPASELKFAFEVSGQYWVPMVWACKVFLCRLSVRDRFIRRSIVPQEMCICTGRSWSGSGH